MELIIKSMADIEIPEEMLNKIDMQSLLNGFRKEYSQLDDLKKVRKKHSEKNPIVRILPSKELKNAHLDSVELQASFSKKLGQLILISIAQSQLLNQQQEQLKKQQSEIKKQTLEISSANDSIKIHQDQLKNQQVELEKLITDYFNLKGLTADGAKKLIEIAQEVHETKENLLQKFSEKHEAVISLKINLEEALDIQEKKYLQLCSDQKIQLANTLKKFEALTTLQNEQINNKISKLENDIHQQEETIKNRLQHQTIENEQSIISITQQLEQQKINSDNQISNIQINLNSVAKNQESNQNEQEILKKKLIQFRALAIASCAASTTSIFWLIWETWIDNLF